MKEASPDIIVITRYLVDKRSKNMQPALEFTALAAEIAPFYFVLGNHEIWTGKYAELKKKILEYNVTVLDNEAVTHNNGSDSLRIIGICDPAKSEINKIKHIDEKETALIELVENNGLEILLAHRPERIEEYIKSEVDIVFSGHAHGGQVRLPFVGGLIAPNQGFFPKYDAGEYKKDGTTMFVGRGLSNSVVPVHMSWFW